jgi:hypothetical protein
MKMGHLRDAAAALASRALNAQRRAAFLAKNPGLAEALEEAREELIQELLWED